MEKNTKKDWFKFEGMLGFLNQYVGKDGLVMVFFYYVSFY